MTASSPRDDLADPLTPGERGREAEVRHRLVAASDGDGFVRFDRFVDVALYAPNVGYYTRPDVRLGPEGDFYTAAQVTRLFGRAIARWIAREHERLGRPRHFTVTEVGVGDGTLARDLVQELPQSLPSETALTYRLVDRSEPMRAAAFERVARAADASSIDLRVAETVSADGPVAGIVLANELLDAIPFRRLVVVGGEWRELGVQIDRTPFAWAERPIEGLTAGLGSAPEGTIAEFSPVVEAIPREIADHLAEGSALLIDFGAEESELLGAHPAGTLAAARRHRPVADPLDHPGLSDLSAFVNFTRLRTAARQSGLVEVAYRGQAEALVDWGLEGLTEQAVRDAPTAEEGVRTRLAVKNLLFGFETFRVLELRTPALRPA